MLTITRQPEAIQKVASQIRALVALAPGPLRVMEFCGGHTHAIARYGLSELLGPGVELIHGPGCPVCVLPASEISYAIALARSEPRVTLCTFGDLLRVPAAEGDSLLRARAEGASVEVLTSPLQAVALAGSKPQREVVWFAIGFETTAPATAAALLQAERLGLKNFSVLCAHLLTVPVIAHLLAEPLELDALLAPGHVAVVIGAEPFRFIAEKHHLPVAISGFEPLEILIAMHAVLQQRVSGSPELSNAYPYAVRPAGNEKAQALMRTVFREAEGFFWRGLGWVPRSALTLAPSWSSWDARRRFPLALADASMQRDHPGCICSEILRGRRKPDACPLFGRACRPEYPLGACMVSAEGACAAYYRYRNVGAKR